jgi:hypothetical protein
MIVEGGLFKQVIDQDGDCSPNCAAVFAQSGKTKATQVCRVMCLQLIIHHPPRPVLNRLSDVGGLDFLAEGQVRY